uniref:Uncharacterized protein n=1 Tax=Romanomermis culicivorax TaxID=13658 RepID=A0A915J2S3_ROMCU
MLRSQIPTSCVIDGMWSRKHSWPVFFCRLKFCSPQLWVSCAFHNGILLSGSGRMRNRKTAMLTVTLMSPAFLYRLMGYVFRGCPRGLLAPRGCQCIPILGICLEDVASQSESSTCDDVVEFDCAAPSQDFFICDVISVTDL